MSRFDKWMRLWDFVSEQRLTLGNEAQKAVLGYLLKGEGRTDLQSVRYMMQAAGLGISHIKSDEVRLFALDQVVRAMFYSKLADPLDSDSSQPYGWQIVTEQDPEFAQELVRLLRHNLTVPEPYRERVLLLCTLIRAELDTEFDRENTVGLFFTLALMYEFEDRLLINVAPTEENIRILTAIALSRRADGARLGHLHEAVEGVDYRARAAALVLRLQAQRRLRPQNFSFVNDGDQLNRLGSKRPNA